MTAKIGRILTIASCRRGHDHGAFSMKWVWESADPHAVVLEAEGTDQFWTLDRVDFTDRWNDINWVSAQVSGVASFKLRASQPEVLSLQLTEHTETGPKVTHVLCRATDVARFMDDVNALAPASYDACVDETLRKILTG